MKVLVVGAGNVGLRLGELLQGSGDFDVTMADCVEEALSPAAALGLEGVVLDAARSEELTRIAAAHDVVVAAVPDWLVHRVAGAALDAGVHYIDFSSRSEQLEALRDKVSAGRAFMPACGVSPGLVDLFAADLVSAFDEDIDLVVRVGALPQERTNRLGYGLIWNLDGLFAEYTKPCLAIRDGRPTSLPPLSDREDLILDGVAYEAFSTADGFGGAGDLAGSFQGRVRNLTFRTIRYPGHLDYMKLLLDDLGLRERKDLWMTLLQNGLPAIDRDMLLIHISAQGMRDGRYLERSELYRIRDGQRGDGADRGGALSLGSAAHAAACIDTLRAGAIPPANGPIGNPDGSPVSQNRFLRGVLSRVALD
jgi:saccharopine dehydrogenase-like NADP-dependent oxidoreductase